MSQALGFCLSVASKRVRPPRGARRVKLLDCKGVRAPGRRSLPARVGCPYRPVEEPPVELVEPDGPPGETLEPGADDVDPVADPVVEPVEGE